MKSFVFFIASLIPYGAGARLICLLSGSKTLQKLFFRGVADAMMRYREALSLDVSSTEMTRRHLIATSFDPWRIKKLSSMTDEEFFRWVTVKNLHLIKETISAGQGVLIASVHIGMARLLPLLMYRSGVDMTTLEADNYYRRHALAVAEKMKSIEMRSEEGFYLKILFKAKKVLSKGGTLLMAPDGLQGMGEGTNYPFLNKERSFFSGFASLAEKTDAKVFWIDVDVQDNGCIEIEFTHSSKPDTDTEGDVVERWVQVYAGHVESVWRRDITKVQRRHLRHFLSI